MKNSNLFLNKRWIFWILIFSILIVFGICTLNDELMVSIVVIAMGAFFLVGHIFLFPNKYRIDEKGITVYYGFGIKTTAQWNELRTIEDHYCRAFLWMREYHIGYFKAEMPVWEKAHIPKNKKTTTLIKNITKRILKNTDDKGVLFFVFTYIYAPYCSPLARKKGLLSTGQTALFSN